ncbi:MAG: hypothetical protein IPM81_19780 [Saprospirales bacterium]|nr:hypothetical protein [Saprospirales bacterium]
MQDLSPLIHALQTQLRAEMSRAGVSYEDAAGPLHYANKSSIARLLVKDRMSFEDTIKLMVLCKTPVIALTKPFRFKIEVKASTMAKRETRGGVCAGCFKEGHPPVPLTGWPFLGEVAEHTGLIGGKKARSGFCCGGPRVGGGGVGGGGGRRGVGRGEAKKKNQTKKKTPSATESKPACGSRKG